MTTGRINQVAIAGKAKPQPREGAEAQPTLRAASRRETVSCALVLRKS